MVDLFDRYIFQLPQTDLLQRLSDVDVVLGVGLLHRVVELEFELDDLLSQIEPLLLAATPGCVLFLTRGDNSDAQIPYDCALQQVSLE